MTRSDITGLILSGGMGRRMGSVDKGLVQFRGQPMVRQVINRLLPQVGSLILNANQNQTTYASFGYPVITDSTSDGLEPFAGPLAGLHAGLLACTTPLLMTAPCDSPFLPADLVARLSAALEESQSDIAVPRDKEHVHPVFMLCRCSVLKSLSAYLARGQRKIHPWYVKERFVEVDFADSRVFANLNTPDELAQLELTEMRP